MKEIYLGTDTDRSYISAYLENIRKLDPLEIATLPHAINLSDDHVMDIIDIGWFREITYHCLDSIRQKYGVQIEPVEEGRCYTVPPPERESIGGFHHEKSLGYQYWYHASFVVALNTSVTSIELRTLEMVRNFLHDCLHHSTFRSYRRAMRVPATSPSMAKHRVPEVYREQYGINFRNKDGVSYSSATLTARSPETINLNLLMDGIIVIVVAEALKIVGELVCQTELEEEIRKEILLEPFSGELLPRAHRFLENVTKPSQKFVKHWGKEEIVALVLRAMMTGDLNAIKGFFRNQTGLENAWEVLFRQPDFSITENPNI